jgi:hypothetical protein
VIENNICEGTGCLNSALSSGVTSRQVMVAHARIVGWGSNGVVFLHFVPYPSAHMYSMQTQVSVSFLITTTDQNLH